MSFLDKLKAIFNLEVNCPLVSVNITKNSNNVTRKEGVYDKAKGKLELYLDNIEEDKKKKIKEIIKESIEEGNQILEINTSELLYQLYQYNKENKNNQILSFFKQIIPPEDFEALESALYLREVFLHNGDVSKLKQDIRKRFGDRGNTIANLCTAGYFEKFLLPLYNSSKDRFNELYEIIVTKSVLAIFVHSGMSQEQIPIEITNKLGISMKYGIKFIHIHGIGIHNINKIKECLEEQKEYFNFFQKEIYEKDNIMIVELLLK